VHTMDHLANHFAKNDSLGAENVVQACVHHPL
jgi:hypothetical protein